jgi:hypothetical protein
MNINELQLSIKKCLKSNETLHEIYIKVNKLNNLSKIGQFNCENLADNVKKLYNYQTHFAKLKKIDLMQYIFLEISLLQVQANKSCEE